MERATPTAGAIALAFAASDARILWRMKTPLIFMFAVPALLSAMLGPAVSGDDGTLPGRSVIGFAVLFSFMTINYMGLALFQEFWGDTWMRQATYRPPKIAFIGGKMCPVVSVGMLQLAGFGAITFAVYPLPLHGSVLQLAVVAVALALCGPLLGVVLYNLTFSVPTFQSVTYLLLLGMGGVGGAIVTPERLPDAVRVLGPFTPHYWALVAFTDTTVGAGAWEVTLRSLAVIGGMIVVLLLLAFVTFDFRSEKYPMG